MTLRRLGEILAHFPDLSIAVAGDAFVDRYYDVDRCLLELSLETDLRAHQVVRVRTYPGGGGNVVQNLVSLGVGRVFAVTCIGGDADGFELGRLLRRAGADLAYVSEHHRFVTPSYNKPMFLKDGKPSREMERLDVRSRRPLPREVEKEFLRRMQDCVKRVDGVLVADQVPEENTGLITARVRRRLSELADRFPDKVFFADSRCRVDKFSNVIIKPNREEAAAALGKTGRIALKDVAAGALAMGRRTGRPLYVTLGGRGCLSVHDGAAVPVATYRPSGTLDIVGAGDSFAAGAMASLCAGAGPEEAALVGNLVASITVQQIGVTGTAARTQLRRRLSDFRRQRKGSS